MQKKTLVSLVGARPQFVKEALVNAAARKAAYWRHVLVHSGQHYDIAMSDVFFQELGIPAPDHHLGIGSGSHAEMTAAALVAVEKVLAREKPEALLVYGDTNTTLAGALAAAKLHIPIIHVEAGIRQEPRTMPEEINRVVTDRLSRVFCCCSALAVDNLAREGITAGVHMTGDVMYDQFLRLQASLTPTETCQRYGLDPEGYIVVTLHRDFNVDSPESLEGLLRGLGESARSCGLAVLFPIHPRTSKRVEEFALAHLLRPFTIVPPLGYTDLMSLTAGAAFVVTDSGGLQKEAYYAGKRALVVMPDTGWRELTESGWNILVPPEAQALAEAARRILQPAPHAPHLYGQGDAALQIVEAIRKELFS